MSGSGRWRAVAAAAGVVVATLAGTGVVAPSAQAAIRNCAPGMTATWDGSAGDAGSTQGDGVSWADAYNWDTDCTPGLVKDSQGGPKPQDDVAILPAGATARLYKGQQASLARLTNAGTVSVATGAVLDTRLDSTSAHTVLKGLLFGTGTFTVTSRMDWSSSTAGASYQATRRCPEECASPAPSPGRTVVAQGATLVVSNLSVGLSDRRVLENRGTVQLTGSGSIAADYGTTFRNLRLAGAPAPLFDIRDDGSYVQGFATSGEPLDAFVNTGVVRKSAGTGRSYIDAAYRTTDPDSPSTGTVQVRSGSFFITTAPGVDVDRASVQQGASFGNGGALGTTSADTSAASVELPPLGTALVQVTIQELAPLAGRRGRPVQISTPGAQATSAQPLRFRLYLDASLRRPGESAVQAAQSAPVYREADGATTYVRLPSCPSGGPTSTQACVDRGASVGETQALAGGDVVLVVASLQNSRYTVG